jgi:zinc-binding alcohol dehydrogenase/oxidoreductase
MRAFLPTKRVSPDEATLSDVPTPIPAAGEVLIRVHAAALNHTDLRVLDRDPEKPQIPGADGSGVVEALSQGVSNIVPGAEVVIWPSMDWGKREDTFDPAFSILGYEKPGTYAEYIAVPAQSVYPKPTHLTHEEAAALPLAAMTAYRALFARAQLQAGETVLVHGIGGGVAIYALQMAVARGARIDGKGVDLVVESLGGEYLSRSLDAVRWGGRIVTFGRTVGKTAEIDVFTLFWNHISLIGSTMGSASDFAGMLELVNTHHLHPVIDTVYPLGQIGQAFKRLDNAEQFGKIVLRMDV